MEARIVYTLQTYILYTKQAYSEPRATWAKGVLTEKQRAEQSRAVVDFIGIYNLILFERGRSEKQL